MRTCFVQLIYSMCIVSKGVNNKAPEPVVATLPGSINYTNSTFKLTTVTPVHTVSTINTAYYQMVTLLTKVTILGDCQTVRHKVLKTACRQK